MAPAPTLATNPPPPIDFTDPVLNQRKLYLFTDLDEHSAEALVAKLHYLDRTGGAPIDLYLNTNGGPARHAFALVDVIRSLRSPVNTWAVGDCRSGGAVVLAAGTGQRRAYPHATVAIHGGVRQGAVPDDYWRLVQDRVDAFWRGAAALPAEWFPLRGNVLHTLTPDEALVYAVIDEIVPNPSAAVR